MAGVASADITSQVVGYTTVSCSAGKFIICGTQFEGMAGGQTIALNDLIKDAPADIPWDGVGNYTKTAPQIQIMNATGGYDYYWYVSDGALIPGTEEYGPGWVDKNGSAPAAGVEVGKGFWFTAKQDCEILLLGQVTDPAKNPTANAKANSFNLISSVYPTSLDLNSANWDGIDKTIPWDGAGCYTKTAPQVQIMNAAGAYNYYWYVSDGVLVNEATEEYGPGWVDKDGLAPAVGVEVGKGFWLKPTTEVNVGF